MGSDRDDENSLAGMPLSEPKEGLTLPPIAAKADDLEAIRQAVEDAASVGVGLWLSYIFVLFYLAIAAGAVTHADLLLKNPVKLPFLSIELPLLAFFFLAPLLSLIVHAYTLVHFVLLAKKAGRFHNELRKQIPDSSENSKAADIRTALQWQLPSNVFVQFLAGPDDIRDGGFGFLLKTIAWTTLVVGPIALLLLLQIQFLPYHHLGITGTHRVALLADLVLIWWLWRKILGGRGDLRGWLSWKSWAKTVLALVPTAFAVLFSWTIATIPDERQETVEFIFGFNTIVLPRFDIYEALKIGDPKKVDWKKYVIDLRGRHLEHAYLEGATLNRADLTGAFLGGAFLDGSDLQGASLNGAHLQGARLYKAQLQGASLVYAELQGAQLSFAQLQGAELGSAQLQGASLVYAELQGAELSIAQLQGAELFNADLQGASLFGAQLQGASLSEAHLQGASLAGAELQGASLSEAHLQGASLEGAQLQGASLAVAELQNVCIPLACGPGPIPTAGRHLRSGCDSGCGWSELAPGISGH